MKYVDDDDDDDGEDEKYENHEKNINGANLFTIKTAQGKGMKILPQKQLLQRLLLLLAQIQAGNTSENLLNENRQIVYTLYSAKQISNKVCNDLLKTI